jgi:dihydropteroate synthase
MGVVNVTPDSFSDGGRFLDHEAAIAHGLALRAEGADVLDVGGESTRPGAAPVPEEVELARVLPVVRELSRHGRVSIDTRKPSVAREAVWAGATLVNDVSATLWPVAAELGVGWVAMHAKGDPLTMQLDPRYEDVVGEVAFFLEQRLHEAREAGISECWLDPGIGFGKTVRHNLELLAHLDRLVAIGAPVMVGVSRKSCLGALSPRLGSFGPEDREEETLAASILAISKGALMVRVHEVRPLAEYLALLDAIARVSGGG